MGSIVYDAVSGTLRPGIVWEMAGIPDLEAAMETDRVYGGATGREKSEDRYDCPIVKAHRTDMRFLEVSIELFGGDNLGDFLPLVNHGYNIISRPFAERLAHSGLTGFATHKGVTVDLNQSDAKAPGFVLLDVVGKGGFCRRWRVKDAPNSCPYCGREPIVCAGCGWCSEYGCPNCGKTVHNNRDHIDQSDGKKLLYGGYPQTLIVEGKDWDGSDWFSVEGHGGGWFVNRRAKDWFERTHTLDVKFKPALVNVEGMTKPPPDR